MCRYALRRRHKNKPWTCSPTHQTVTLDPTSDKSQGGGGGPDPLPMLQMEAHAQFYMAKNMWEYCKGQSKYC